LGEEEFRFEAAGCMHAAGKDKRWRETVGPLPSTSRRTVMAEFALQPLHHELGALVAP
jgi:hypothetical protein